MAKIIGRMRQVMGVAAAAHFCSVDFFPALVKIVCLEDEAATCKRASGSPHSTVWCDVNAKP